MRINSLILKNGEPVPLNHKVTVFVGPNNSGKSQTLKDIRCLMDRQQSQLKEPIILKNDTSCFTIPDISTIKRDLFFTESKVNVDHYTVEGVSSNLFKKNIFEVHFNEINNFDGKDDIERRRLFFQWFSKSYLALMDAETRLKLSSETPSFTPSESTPDNLLQSLFLHPEVEEVLLGAWQKCVEFVINKNKKD